MFDRVPIPQSVARKIQGMIFSGQLASGARIPSQRELAEQLGVSRASLREGLLQLETIGLIRTDAGRGTFVVDQKPSQASNMAPWRYSDSFSVFEVFQTRVMLEGHIALLAVGNLSANDFAVLEEMTDTMERFWKEGDLLANVEADLEFHATIARACANKMLMALYVSVRRQLTETQRQPIPVTAPTRMEASIAEHREIILALRGGEAHHAKAAMEQHVRNTAVCAGLDVSAL